MPSISRTPDERTIIFRSCNIAPNRRVTAFRVTRQTRIYRRADNRHYCRRPGGIIGNRLDRGQSSIMGTLIGAGAGPRSAGRSIAAAFPAAEKHGKGTGRTRARAAG